MINETKSWFFTKINKIDKPVTRLINTKRERTPVNKIRDEKGEVITNMTEIKRPQETTTTKHNCMSINWATEQKRTNY